MEDANQNGRWDRGETNPLTADTDGDGLSDGVEGELHGGTVPEGETHPLEKDTDGDACLTARRRSGGLSPVNPDSDSDGLTDGVEDLNQNGVHDPGESNPAAKTPMATDWMMG